MRWVVQHLAKFVPDLHEFLAHGSIPLRIDLSIERRGLISRESLTRPQKAGLCTLLRPRGHHHFWRAALMRTETSKLGRGSRPRSADSFWPDARLLAPTLSVEAASCRHSPELELP